MIPDMLKVPEGVTVAQLKQHIATWPEHDQHGKPTEVWLCTDRESFATNPCVSIQPLNYRGGTRESATADLLLCPASVPEKAGELEELRKWKREAMTLLMQWHKVWEDAGGPGLCGETKTGAVTNMIRATRAWCSTLGSAVAGRKIRYRLRTHPEDRPIPWAEATVVQVLETGDLVVSVQRGIQTPMVLAPGKYDIELLPC